MATEEEQQLLARIGQLAGRINRHRQQQQPRDRRSAPYPFRGIQPALRGRGGFHRGFHRGRGGAYRNRTLVLNAQADAGRNGDEAKNSSGWVSKNNGSLQLINRAVFKDEAPVRIKQQEDIQRQKLQQRDVKERAWILHRLRQTQAAPSMASSNFEVIVDDIRFQVTKQGSKLLRVPGQATSTTPKVAVIGGVVFHRTKNGNYIRHAVAAQLTARRERTKVEEACKTFSWTGSCPKGPRCRYAHDASKVAICREWLNKGECPSGDACDLSHDATDQRTPFCFHNAKGACNKDSCPYLHTKHSPSDPVCKAFGFYGYCDQGAECSGRHAFECPDFSNTGVCRNKGCKLPHPVRAHLLRKAGVKEEEDVLSDEEAASGSDDIDSDEAEHLFGDEEEMDFESDFISFS